MVYPAVFSGARREVKLDGEGYFEVKHDRKSPFVVHTQKCDIEVLGTKFNVEAYSDSEEFSTSLMEGSVKVTDNSATSASVLLKPSQEVHLRMESCLFRRLMITTIFVGGMDWCALTMLLSMS